MTRCCLVSVFVLGLGCGGGKDGASDGGTSGGSGTTTGQATGSGSGSGGTGDGSGTGGSDASGAGTSSGASSGASGATTDATGGGLCEPTAESTCSQGPCGAGASDPGEFDHCGASNLFDRSGCMRAQCDTDMDCGENERCYSTLDCFPDACVPSTWTCEDGEDGCTCGGPGDCDGALRWCIPSASAPC